jgi:hypothetical protein
MRRREHPIEALILLCARLDALASDAAKEDTSSKQAFRNLLEAYSGERRLFESVSVGDLYYELAYHRWLLEGTLPKPGRLHRFSKVDDPVLHLLEDAGLPLVLEESRILLDTLLRIFEHNFHVRPRQPRSKPRTIRTAALTTMLVQAAQRTRLRRVAENLPTALGPLIESKRISALLYERFRCESIHGATIIINKSRFFAETDAYWEAQHSESYGFFELIEFPAAFLLRCLDTCIAQYRAHLLVKGKISPAIHFHAFSDDVLSELQFLDESLLPAGGDVRLKINR